MKKKVITIVVIIVALILLFPIPFRLKDGGSIRFQALLYSVTKYHKLNHTVEDGYIDGFGIEILGMEVYNNTDEQENKKNENEQIATSGKVIIGHDKITNIHLLDNFLDNTNQYNENKSSSKVEIVTYTIEGDEIITTLEYSKENNEFVITKDNTRDEFAAEKDRKVETKKYSNDTYNLEKKIKNDYIHLVLVSDELEVNICAYEKELEENNKNFKLIFNGRKDLGIKTIVANEETDKYSYNIFSKGGDIEIKINGVIYDFREALLSEKITMEEIIEKADKDFPNTVSYDDGGSMEYHYEEYTIVKYHKLDGNRDVYIGPPTMTINNIKKY